MGTYIASNKCPVPEGVWPHESRFSVHRYCRQTVDAPVHVATCASGDHAQMEDYNDGTRCLCMTNYGFTHVHCA